MGYKDVVRVSIQRNVSELVWAAVESTNRLLRSPVTRKRGDVSGI